PLQRNYLCLHVVQIVVYVATSVPQPAFPLPGERLFFRSHFLPFSHFPLSFRGIFMTLKDQSPERIESSNSGASVKAMIRLRRNPTTTGIHISNTCWRCQASLSIPQAPLLEVAPGTYYSTVAVSRPRARERFLFPAILSQQILQDMCRLVDRIVNIRESTYSPVPPLMWNDGCWV
ncbi:hypothetical protein BGW80DRAFT_1362301, partial [Lactifluus volemus]